MKKNQLSRVTIIIITLILINLSWDYQLGFSESFQGGSNNKLINPSEIKWVRVVGGLNLHT
jgi:hypothetical protein